MVLFYPRANISIHELEKKINRSEKGLSLDWKDLLLLANDFSQIFEVMILGCVDVHFLKRYENKAEMHKNCDIIIELIDCAFWEVYAKDYEIISILKNKFHNTEELKN